jgi:hypothetical protein
MKVKLKNGKLASEEAIASIEAVVGPLSESVRNFLVLHDGAEPESNSFSVGDKCGSGVSRFIPASEILQHRKYIDGLPQTAYPVAQDDCGNFVFVDEARSGVVYFWDHELLDDPVELALTFDAFLDLLALRRFDDPIKARTS